MMDYSRSQPLTWILILLLIVDKNDGTALSVDVTGDALTGTTISLTCTIPTFSQTAEWKNPALSTGAIQSCTAGFCAASNPTYPGYTFSTNASAFTVTIVSAKLDDNEWTCEHDTAADSSGPQTLDLKVPPTTCTLVESGGVYTCTSSCGYPANVMSIRAKLNGTSNTQTLTSLTAVSAPNCTSPESAYSVNVPTSFFTQSADLYCECGVSGFESTFIQSNSVAVTAATTTTTTTPATTTTTPASSSSSIGDLCTPTFVWAVIGLVVASVCQALCYIVYFQPSVILQGPCPVFIKSRFSVEQTRNAAIIVTILCVIGFVLCVIGIIGCISCWVTKGWVSAGIGSFLTFVALVIIFVCWRVNTKKNCGQTIKHVSVKNNDPLTLTCPAGDLATTLTWTGPGGIPYVTGTTVEADLDGSVKRRISASHKKRGYALMFTEVWSSDMGIYTSTVDETVVKHEVIVQDNKAVRARPDGQDAKPRTERTPRSAGDGSNDTPRRKLEDVPQGRKLPALELVDASQKANTLEPLEVNETKKLKKKKKRRSKEERAQVDGEY